MSGIERREFNPTVDILERLTDALGADLGELFLIPGSDDPKPEPLRPGRRAAR